MLPMTAIACPVYPTIGKCCAASSWLPFSVLRQIANRLNRYILIVSPTTHHTPCPSIAIPPAPSTLTKHYSIDPITRLDWEEIHGLIAAEKFFVLHAPRQTGKTSTLLAMMDVLNQSDEYTALYINVESAQAARGDVQQGMKTILDSLVQGAAIRLKDARLRDWREDIWHNSGAHSAQGNAQPLGWRIRQTACAAD